jgi:hypothetical protein
MKPMLMIMLSMFGLATDVDLSRATFSWCPMRSAVACDGPGACTCPKAEPNGASALGGSAERRDIEAFRYHAAVG